MRDFEYSKVRVRLRKCTSSTELKGLKGSQPHLKLGKWSKRGYLREYRATFDALVVQEPASEVRQPRTVNFERRLKR